jgi:hypothetical protein
MTFMNYLVFLDPYAGELAKILSGIKSMVIKEFDPTRPSACQIKLGDSLYFLRNNDECDLRVKASAVRVMVVADLPNEGLSHILKEMQPRLQLTENQYIFWSTKRQALFVEFESAHKIDVVHIATSKITDRSDWIAFKELDLIM